MIELKENERIDDLNRNGYRIIQNPEKFCFGMDAVLLTGFTKVKKNENLIDLGTGTGVIPILLCAKTKGSSFIGIEIQDESVDMARRSVELNHIEDKVRIEKCDIKRVSDMFEKHSFSVVTSNPPYMNAGSGMINSSDPKAIARHEIAVRIDDVCRASSELLKFGGRFYVVYRPNRLVDLLVSMRKYSLEPKTIRFVQSYEGKEPNTVLVEAMKFGKPMLRMIPNLIVYKNDGSYTDEVRDIYYK